MFWVARLCRCSLTCILYILYVTYTIIWCPVRVLMLVVFTPQGLWCLGAEAAFALCV